VSPTGQRYRYENAFKAACEAAGVEGFRFYDLRHSAATYLAREGASEQQLKAIGGWKSGGASRYIYLAAMETRDIVQKMNERTHGKQAPTESAKTGVIQLLQALHTVYLCEVSVERPSRKRFALCAICISAPQRVTSTARMPFAEILPNRFLPVL
jgi:hypothetical protein